MKEKKGYVTFTVPTIPGCTAQWYGNSPAAVNVCSNVVPLLASFVNPESNALPASGEPNSPDVTVCKTVSSFVHTTFWPTFTSTGLGLYDLSAKVDAPGTMDTGASAPWAKTERFPLDVTA